MVIAIVLVRSEHHVDLLGDEPEAQSVELLEDPDQSNEVRLRAGVELQGQLVDIVQHLGVYPVRQTTTPTPFSSLDVYLGTRGVTLKVTKTRL